MIALILLFLSILDFSKGPELVYALEKSSHALTATKVELPTYYLIFVFLGIALITWGIIEIFHHEDDDH
jgi:hypothetical protein